MGGMNRNPIVSPLRPGMTPFSDTVFARLLRRLAGAVCHHPRWFVYPQIGLALAGVLYSSAWLKLDMSRSHLVGTNLRQQRIHLKYRKEFPREDELVVVVQSGRMERNRQFVERLAARIAPQTNLFTDLFYKGDLATFGPKALLLVPTHDLEEMRRVLHECRTLIQEFAQAANFDSLFGLVNKQFRTASAADPATTATLVQRIPYLQRLIEQAQQSLLRPGVPPSPGVETLFAGGQQAEQSMYLAFDQGQVYLLTVHPRSEALTPKAIEELRRLIGATQFEVTGVNVGLTGEPVLEYDEMRQAGHDSMAASIVAMVLGSVIFIVAYGQAWRPFKAALCLLLGLGCSLGFTTLAIGHLNILTITFAPMLIGLAMDFGIHFISRYEEEMRNRRTETEAIERATALTGRGIIAGGVTMAVAFLAMALTDFRGIQEMGIISGCGVLLCLIPMMTCLPLLLRRGRQNLLDHQMGPTHQRRLDIEVLWLRHPVLVLGTTLLLCAGATFQFPRVWFDYDLLHLQSQSLPSVVYEKTLIEATGIEATGSSTLHSEVIADSAAQAREYEQKIKRLPSVALVRSAAGYITEDQSRKLELIRSIKGELAAIRFAPMDQSPVKLEQLSVRLYDLAGYLGLAAFLLGDSNPALARQLGSLEGAIGELRFAMLRGQPEIPVQLTLFQQAFFADLHQTLAAIKSQDTTGPLGLRDLPPALHDRFIGATGKYLLQVYARKDLWHHANQREFLQELTTVVPPDQVTGKPSQLYQYSTLLKDSYEQAAVYALIAITLAVLIQFRSLVAVALALLPVVIGTTWLLGWMGLVGIPFNPANIITLPLVVGIGVTNGIQVLNRFAEQQEPSILAKSTGKAVLVSGLTAIAGFGSLMLANHQGIKSLGEVMSAGIAACMVAALMVLPALLRLLTHWGWTLKPDRRRRGNGVETSEAISGVANVARKP
jgi:hopanoid biosynthesis associated RND transporter like protein HpnN